MSRSARPIHFGYVPTTGQRGLERVDPRTFTRDLHQVLEVAKGIFGSFWISDHVMSGANYRLECWTQLCWMAARYPGVMIGTNVLCNSYRYPPMLAKAAASLQELSGGRLILGYGAGWSEEEYRAYGYEFPSTRTRIAQMVEGIRVMRALWAGHPATFEGEHYHVADAYCEPRPNPPPPILIGGDGEKYLLRAVAEQADMWLPFSRTVEELRRKMDVLRGHCSDVGRDYDAIRKTYKLTVHLSRDRAAAQASLAAAAERENPPFAGTPVDLREHLTGLVEAGVDLFQLQFPNFPETDDMALFAAEVMPAFR